MAQKFLQLGRTGIKVSNLCLGAMMFGGKTNFDDSAAIIDRALDAGINFIDTANVYNAGRSEEATGQALKRNGKRNAVVLATKVHGKMGNGPNDLGNSRRHILEQCDASLKRLQTDYIDLYQIHRPDPHIPIDETLRALDDLIRAGKVRYIGSSTYAAWQLVESLWVAKEQHLNRFVCEQPPYHILDRRIERELIPMAQTYGFGVIPWSPLAGGMLTGKYKRGEAMPDDSRWAAYQSNPMMRRRWTESLYDAVEALLPIAAGKGCALSQFSLAWCMAQAGVTSPIIGPRTLEQLNDNLQAFDVEITVEDCKAVDAVVGPGTHITAYYEADFGPHPYRV